MLSPEAATWLHGALAEMSDSLSGDSLRRVFQKLEMKPAVAAEIQTVLQSWRDLLTPDCTPPISRELVEKAFEALTDVADLRTFSFEYPNDAELGAAVRPVVFDAGDGVLRARALLKEAITCRT